MQVHARGVVTGTISAKTIREAAKKVRDMYPYRGNLVIKERG